MDERGAGLIGALLEQRYRVDALLAHGGMSSVYRGLDTRLDRRVAIKVMDSRFADDRSFVDRFEREARSAAKIHHPNVVAVHDQGVDRSPGGDLVYLVMELVDGGTLRDLISARGALDIPLAFAIIEPVLAALAAAHRVGLVHRDVKPENVLIGHEGERGTTVKVGDFGLVRAVASAGTTSSSVILGTVAYLSPEQVTTGNASARGDVYSAGILLYEMLTGLTPYTGDNPLSIAYRHVNDDIPAPSMTVAGLPPALDELVVRATRRDASARPADGATFLAEVQSLRARLAVPRVGIPVPAPTLADRTMPVAPMELRRAQAWSPPDSTTATKLNLADLTQPATPAVALPTPLPTPPPTPVPSGAGVNATIVRQVPAGFTAAGPQGTRAMLRTDLDRLAPQEVGPPSLGLPMAGPVPPPRRTPPATPGRGTAAPAPRARRGTLVLWSLVTVLVLAIAGSVTWWFVDGRWSTVPEVAGRSTEEAQKLLLDSDLRAELRRVPDNEVAAGVAIRTEPDRGADVLRGEPVTLVVSSGRPKVPDVRAGTSVAAAEEAIRGAQLQPGLDDGINEYSDEVDKGKVVRLDPEPGTELKLGERVEIVVSKGPEPKPVPDLRGKTREEAFAELESLGYAPFDLGKEFDEDIDGGRVVRTDPSSGNVPEGDKRVGVVLSDAVTVPDVGGRNAEEASDILASAGLQAEVQAFGGTGRVFGQNPPPGSRVQSGSRVVIFTLP
ncbi:Stk1 family PASTA domain-containing Ser/Thr kinase [Actinophytocola xanthii]|uniref:Stk1 family PASTA domain-containing Ser/Thr kinase n=1 Tax=Actinophytocola xanthii TaxID=1912961 RepID=UPI001E37B9C6|nr:Stk1 family PASTA domain-containing Ser/Thr kinase [Actinophytocola xanthii]